MKLYIKFKVQKIPPFIATYTPDDKPLRFFPIMTILPVWKFGCPIIEGDLHSYEQSYVYGMWMLFGDSLTVIKNNYDTVEINCSSVRLSFYALMKCIITRKIPPSYRPRKEFCGSLENGKLIPKKRK